MPASSTPKPRHSWLRFSLRSLLILTTLICVGIVARQQYVRWRNRTLVHAWIAPLVEADDEVVPRALRIERRRGDRDPDGPPVELGDPVHQGDRLVLGERAVDGQAHRAAQARAGELGEGAGG